MFIFHLFKFENCERIKFSCFKPPSVRWVVTAVLGNTNSHYQLSVEMELPWLVPKMFILLILPHTWDLSSILPTYQLSLKTAVTVHVLSSFNWMESARQQYSLWLRSHLYCILNHHYELKVSKRQRKYRRDRNKDRYMFMCVCT